MKDETTTFPICKEIKNVYKYQKSYVESLVTTSYKIRNKKMLLIQETV